MYLKRSAEFSIEFVTIKATLVFCLEATSASFPTLDRSFGIIGDITSRAVTGFANMYVNLLMMLGGEITNTNFSLLVLKGVII
jgi:hypothetical protein